MNLEAVPEQAHYTAAEFSAALCNTSEADNLRLLRIARAFALGTGLEGDDLFQEAIVRSLTEERRWPRGVSLVMFLKNVMRSIADSKRKELRRERTKNKSATSLKDISLSKELSAVETACAQQEDTDRNRKLVSEIMALFEGDEEAQWVLIGDFDGSTPSEICRQNSIDATQLATIRRRIRRNIDAAYPKGSRP